MPGLFQVLIHVLNQNEHNSLQNPFRKLIRFLILLKTNAINEIMPDNHKVNLERQRKREKNYRN
jgi:hypothetical protein